MKKILTSFFCIIYLFFSVHIAYASTSVGGWNVTNTVAQGAATVFTAVKNGATAVAKIRPTPEQIARGALRGAMGGLLLTVAQSLIEDGVDFVLDPANNSIRYKPKVCSDNSCPYFYYNGNDGIKYTSSASAAEVMFQILQKGNSSLSSYKFYQTVNNIDYYTGFFGPSVKNDSYIQIVVVKNSSYDEKNTKSIPLTQIASQAIDAADNGNKDAQALTTAVAQTATATNTDDQIVPATQLSQALDASAPSKPDDAKSPTTNPTTNTNSQTQTQDQTQSQTDNPASAPTASPSPSNVPTDCGFFQTACNWFTWTKTQYNDAVDNVKNFSKDDLQDKDTQDQIDTESLPKNIATDTFKFNGMCPADIVTQIPDPMGGSNPLTLSFNNFCTWLLKLNPWTDVLGWIIAITIISGQRSSNSE